jgi:hypothetical protein
MRNNDWVAYSLIDGIATTLCRGTENEAFDCVKVNRGKRGLGSVHIAYRPLAKSLEDTHA